MLIFIAGQSPIFGKQLLYFQDPTLSKRSAIRPPDKQFTIEHHGDILSPGTLHYASETTSTRGIIQSPNREKTPKKPEASPAPTATTPSTTASPTSGSSQRISDGGQMTNAPGLFKVLPDHTVEVPETRSGDGPTTAPADEMKEVFEELEVGMEDMDKNFQLHHQTKTHGDITNER
jgi:hypothetical protein